MAKTNLYVIGWVAGAGGRLPAAQDSVLKKKKKKESSNITIYAKYAFMLTDLYYTAHNQPNGLDLTGLVFTASD